MRKLLPVLISLLVLALGVAAAAPKPDFTLGVNPVSQSVPQGQSASYSVTAAPADGFSGSIALTAKGQPGTASFAPPSLSGGTSVLTLGTAGAAPGSYPVTIIAASGKLSHSITVTLTVNRVLSPSISLSASPATATVPVGSTAVYPIGIGRTNFAGPVTLSVYSGLPSGATAVFQPNPVTGSTATLQVATSATTPPGNYPLYLVGTSAAGPGYAPVQLQVAAPAGKAFAISGGPTGTLAPGAPARPADLLLQNPNNQDLAITNLTVTVQKTSAAGCPPDNFAVTQYSGPYPLRLGARRTATLSQLGVPAAGLPRIAMLDLPTSQDACKNVTLTLAFSGAGQGA